MIFFYAGQMPPDMHWRNREKSIDLEYHEKASFFSSS